MDWQICIPLFTPPPLKEKILLTNSLRNCVEISLQNLCVDNGRFQKISIPYHGRLLGFPKGRGGSRLWNSEGMGGIYDWKSEGMGEFHRWDFWSRKCRVSYLKTHFGISKGKGELRHGSRPWLGMDIFWNCPIQ